jgi:rhodanese-related sulfurtransferase
VRIDVHERDPLQQRHAQRESCGILRQACFQRVRNMKRGILAWSDTVDPSVPKY